MKTCYVIGAGECDRIEIKKQENDLVICADGGLAYAKKFAIRPDLTVGDFDSYGFVPNDVETIVHPTQKDETDTLLALNYALEKGYKNFVLYAMLGGRPDHTYANIQLLSYLAEKGAASVIVGAEYNITVVKNGRLDLPKKENGFVSVFSFSEKSRGVSIKGLKYEVNDFEITSSYPIGVSNEFLGKDASISVENGTLIVMYQNM